MNLVKEFGQYCKVQEAAVVLRLKPKANHTREVVKKLINEGKLDGHKAGKFWLVTTKSLENYMRESRVLPRQVYATKEPEFIPCNN